MRPLGFTLGEWLKATIGALLFVAVAYPLIVFAIVAGQP